MYARVRSNVQAVCRRRIRPLLPMQLARHACARADAAKPHCGGRADGGARDCHRADPKAGPSPRPSTRPPSATCCHGPPSCAGPHPVSARDPHSPRAPVHARMYRSTRQSARVLSTRAHAALCRVRAERRAGCRAGLAGAAAALLRAIEAGGECGGELEVRARARGSSRTNASERASRAVRRPSHGRCARPPASKRRQRSAVAQGKARPSLSATGSLCRLCSSACPTSPCSPAPS
jgi:hypothetical protein